MAPQPGASYDPPKDANFHFFGAPLRYSEVNAQRKRTRAKKEDPGPEPEVLTGQDYTSCVDHHLITTSQDFECHSLGGVDTPDLRDWPPRLREARGAGGPLRARGRVGDPPDQEG